MKKKIRNVLLLTVVMVMCFSATALAGSTGFLTKTYGSFSISCYISCTSTTGISQTKGAPYGYKNAANIIIRNGNGVSLGGDSVTTSYNYTAVAQKTNSGGNVKSALSGHYVKDSDGNPAAPLYQQINMVQYP